MNKPLFAANWKMYRTHAQTVDYCTEHIEQYRELASNSIADVVIFPSFETVASLIQLLPKINIGAQDCSAHDLGAHTGQVSAQSLHELGCKYVIIGHSERRAAGDTDGIVAHRLAQAFKAGLIPILCIGEPADIYNERLISTQMFLTAQLTRAIPVLKSNRQLPFNIAYEPIWAIGSGKTPTVPEIEHTQAFIREFIQRETGATNFRVLYGGSVGSKNAAKLKTIKPFEGFLIGKASLDVGEFAQIINLIN